MLKPAGANPEIVDAVVDGAAEPSGCLGGQVVTDFDVVSPGENDQPKRAKLLFAHLVELGRIRHVISDALLIEDLGDFGDVIAGGSGSVEQKCGSRRFRFWTGAARREENCDAQDRQNAAALQGDHDR